MSGCLIGMHLMGVRPIGMHFMSVYLTGVHLVGVLLTCLMGVLLTCLMGVSYRYVSYGPVVSISGNNCYSALLPPKCPENRYDR